MLKIFKRFRSFKIFQDLNELFRNSLKHHVNEHKSRIPCVHLTDRRASAVTVSKLLLFHLESDKCDGFKACSFLKVLMW